MIAVPLSIKYRLFTYLNAIEVREMSRLYEKRTMPQALQSQLEDAAEHFALALKNTAPGVAIEVPDWLSVKTQNWIQSHSDEFGAMVILHYKKIMAGEDGARPYFILPDPKAGMRKLRPVPA